MSMVSSVIASLTRRGGASGARRVEGEVAHSAVNATRAARCLPHTADALAVANGVAVRVERQVQATARELVTIAQLDSFRAQLEALDHLARRPHASASLQLVAKAYDDLAHAVQRALPTWQGEIHPRPLWESALKGHDQALDRVAYRIAFDAGAGGRGVEAACRLVARMKSAPARLQALESVAYADGQQEGLRLVVAECQRQEKWLREAGGPEMADRFKALGQKLENLIVPEHRAPAGSLGDRFVGWLIATADRVVRAFQ